MRESGEDEIRAQQIMWPLVGQGKKFAQRTIWTMEFI